MTSRADKVRERIVDLSDLITAARKSLADLGEDNYAYAKFLRTNLRATIEAVQSELARAERELDGALGLDAAVEILANVKMQAREGRRTAKWAKPRAQTKLALKREVAQDAAKAILASATAKAKERMARAKKRT